jgi:hypothetical protein
MKRFLIAGAAIVFAGIAATVAVAADHKPKVAQKPVHATVLAPDKATTGHKGAAHKRHHRSRRHHAAHRTHAT